jgi:gluconokinase
VDEAVRCLATVLAHTGGRRVLGVGVSTFWHSVLGVGADGAARTPILLWSDTRSAPQVARLRETLDPAAYSERTGCPLHTSFLPGRLLWLAEEQPATFAACPHFLSPGEYLFSRLFGPDGVTCSTSMASATGLLDQFHQTWDQETLSRVPGLTPDRLSPIGDAPCQGLLPPYRKRLSPLSDIPWLPASGDGACSNVGCGATAADRIALMVGTSGALRVAVPSAEPPALPPGLWRYQIGPARFLLGGALSNGGSVWGWIKRTLALPDGSDAELEATLTELPPDGHGLTVLPFFSGERAPLWRDDLRATIHGMTAATTPVEVARACMEAVALRFAALRETLRPVAPGGQIVGSGAGLIASPVWARMIADALGEPLLLSSEEQASARGAALLARERLGLGSIEQAPEVPATATLIPEPVNTRTYATARARQEALLQKLLEP